MTAHPRGPPDVAPGTAARHRGRPREDQRSERESRRLRLFAHRRRLDAQRPRSTSGAMDCGWRSRAAASTMSISWPTPRAVSERRGPPLPAGDDNGSPLYDRWTPPRCAASSRTAHSLARRARRVAGSDALKCLDPAACGVSTDT
jgi:hypothetical protein